MLYLYQLSIKWDSKIKVFLNLKGLKEISDHIWKCMPLREKNKKEMEPREQWIQYRRQAMETPQDNGRKGPKVSVMQEV